MKTTGLVKLRGCHYDLPGRGDEPMHQAKVTLKHTQFEPHCADKGHLLCSENAHTPFTQSVEEPPVAVMCSNQDALRFSTPG